ncbi:MAG: nuclear transport factor 2 family protein [Deltaproteobacteria bacterium]|nr:nuclear transport factor 2 family protein [Deltaproteobacteria bacterium]
MNHQEMKDIIDRYIHAYNSFDIHGMLSFMHRDIIFRNISQGQVNLSAKGSDEVRQVAEQAAGLFKSRFQRVENCRFDENTVSVDIDYEDILAGDIPDGPRAGERLKLRGKSVVSFRDGLISSLVDYS